jgi:hypothetical protein
MDIEALEDDLVLKLSMSISPEEIDVMPLPEGQKDYKRAAERPLITVGFQESNFKPELSNGPVIQEEELTIYFTLQAKVKRSPLGIYAMRNMVLEALIGWTPANCTVPFQVKYFGPPKYDDALTDGVWQYELHMCTMTMLVQKNMEEESILTTYTSPIFNG